MNECCKLIEDFIDIMLGTFLGLEVDSVLLTDRHCTVLYSTHNSGQELTISPHSLLSSVLDHEIET